MYFNSFMVIHTYINIKCSLLVYFSIFLSSYLKILKQGFGKVDLLTDTERVSNGTRPLRYHRAPQPCLCLTVDSSWQRVKGRGPAELELWQSQCEEHWWDAEWTLTHTEASFLWGH